MFHLCENWCLFETENPEAESWYYDPWKRCWREQYAGVGTHRQEKLPSQKYGAGQIPTYDLDYKINFEEN